MRQRVSRPCWFEWCRAAHASCPNAHDASEKLVLFAQQLMRGSRVPLSGAPCQVSCRPPECRGPHLQRVFTGTLISLTVPRAKVCAANSIWIDLGNRPGLTEKNSWNGNCG